MGLVVTGDGLIAQAVLTSQLLECLSCGLWDQKSGEYTQEHEQRVDLHDMVLPWVGDLGGCATGTEGCDGGLSDNTAHLSRCG